VLLYFLRGSLPW
jgi:cell fate (sporulation/competence/biofilm development) regulator YlbF (YheA/YmcA/DUF963 family)